LKKSCLSWRSTVQTYAIAEKPGNLPTFYRHASLAHTPAFTESDLCQPSTASLMVLQIFMVTTKDLINKEIHVLWQRFFNLGSYEEKMNTIDLSTGKAFLECHYKAYLLSNEKSGEETEYELLLNDLKEIYMNRFVETTKCCSNSIIFNFQICSGKYKLKLDALESIKSQDSEDSQYIPYFVLPNEKITAAQKLLAGFTSLCLNDVDYPSKTARIVYGCKQKTIRVGLEHYIENAKRLLRDLENFSNQSTELE